MSDQIQQKDINNAAWSACETFSEVMDAAGYKDSILVMPLKYGGNDKRIWRRLKKLVMPLKYGGNDKRIWRRLKKLVMPLKYGGNDKRIWRRLKNERSVLPESSFYDLISAVDSEGHKPRLYTLDAIISGDHRVTVTSITTPENHVGGIADIDQEAVTSDDRADGLVRLLQSWMDEGDADEQRETLEYLIHALDEDRLSDRKLFPKELKGKSW